MKVTNGHRRSRAFVAFFLVRYRSCDHSVTAVRLRVPIVTERGSTVIITRWLAIPPNYLPPLRNSPMVPLSFMQRVASRDF